MLILDEATPVLDLKSLLKPRNGKATPSHEYSASIERVKAEMVEGNCELERLDDAERTAVLDYDNKKLDEIARKRLAQKRLLEAAAAALPLLQEKLAAARDEERGVEWSRLRSAILEAADDYDADGHQLCGSFMRLIALREQASSRGFQADVVAIPIAPGLLNLSEPGTPQLAMFESLLATYRQTPSTPAPLTSPRRDNTPFGNAAVRPPAPKELPIIAHGIGAGPVRLYVEPAGPGSRKPAAEAAPKPSPTSQRPAPAPVPVPPAPPPVVLPEPDIDGNIEIVILRMGAEVAGKGRRAGEQIKVPFADAVPAVKAGLADFASGEAAK